MPGWRVARRRFTVISGFGRKLEQRVGITYWVHNHLHCQTIVSGRHKAYRQKTTYQECTYQECFEGHDSSLGPVLPPVREPLRQRRGGSAAAVSVQNRPVVLVRIGGSIGGCSPFPLCPRGTKRPSHVIAPEPRLKIRDQRCTASQTN